MTSIRNVKSGHNKDHSWKRFNLGVAQKRKAGGKDRSKAKAHPRAGYKKRGKR